MSSSLEQSSSVTDHWDRFWTRVQIKGECWLWVGARDPEGYGNFWADRKRWRAHRFAYTVKVGPIPEELQLDHLCRNTSCVNPAHLEVVTGAENRRRGNGFPGRQARQTYCVHGHPLDEENTYRWRGHRSCRTCRREALRRHSERAIS